MKATFRHVDIETGRTLVGGLGQNEQGISPEMEMTSTSGGDRIVSIESLTDSAGFCFIRVWIVRQES